MKRMICRLIALFLVTLMILATLYGCKDEIEKSNAENETEQGGNLVIKELPPMTTDTISLTYMCHISDVEISEALEKEFEALYPNIDVVVETFDTISGNGWDFFAKYVVAGKLADCFWLSGNMEKYFEKGMLYDMTELWENDPDAENVLKGINEYKLGYYGTDRKWATPIKFNPTVAFVNMDVFIRNDRELPDMDWTWEEFETTVENMTIKDKESGKHIFGITSSSNIYEWYPLASDKECIGEFGWNGAEFNMTSWAYGIELEKKWHNNKNMPYDLAHGGVEQLVEMYGDGKLTAESIGCSAIHCAKWNYYNNEYDTAYVPYMMPHTENIDDGNFLAEMEMGAIASTTEYPREAYELLKFMTWGAEGWKYKLKYYQELLEESTGGKRLITKDNMPITLDEKVWEGFKNWYPNSEVGDSGMIDSYSMEYDRTMYYDYFMDRVRESIWACNAEMQVPGFAEWYNTEYCTMDYNFDVISVEFDCLYGGKDAKTYCEKLEESANEYYEEAKGKLESLIQTEGGLKNIIINKLSVVEKNDTVISDEVYYDIHYSEQESFEVAIWFVDDLEELDKIRFELAPNGGPYRNQLIKEHYQKLLKSFLDEMGWDESKGEEMALFTPVLRSVTLTKDEILKASESDKVSSIFYYK